MAKDAYPFLSAVVGLAALAFFLQWWAAGAVLCMLAGFIAFFFRDPQRTIPVDEALVVSPADGRVVRIEDLHLGEMGSARRVSIFLSVFNVHINRLPMAGNIIDIQYRKGKFLAAFDHKASQENERNSVWLQSQQGKICVTQIAGLIARRIVCWKKPGDNGEKGERFGLIRFGSRVDLDLPADVELLVKVGDRVCSGSTAVARWSR
jgi:phosphatidylserine decarboxylase